MAAGALRLHRPPNESLEEGAAEGRRRETDHWTTKPASATIDEPAHADTRVDHWAPRPPCAFAAI